MTAPRRRLAPSQRELHRFWFARARALPLVRRHRSAKALSLLTAHRVRTLRDPQRRRAVCTSTCPTASARGPWNEGQGPWAPGESWVYIGDPVKHVIETQGLTKEKIQGTNRTHKDVTRMNAELADIRSAAIRSAVPKGSNQWSSYPQDTLESPTP